MTNHKSQINSKLQITITKTFEILNLGYWDLFGICYLEFVI